MFSCSNINISEKSAFMEWKESLKGRTSAAVLSVAYHWCQFWYFSSFVRADFFRSVELSDHLVNLGKTSVCRLCIVFIICNFSNVFPVDCVFQRSILVLIVPVLDHRCYDFKAFLHT